MPKIDGARVLADLQRLRDFGRYKTGVHRPTYSAEDVASRRWLAGKFAEAGLDPVVDGIGNVIGHNPKASRRLLVTETIRAVSASAQPDWLKRESARLDTKLLLYQSGVLVGASDSLLPALRIITGTKGA